MLQYCYVTFCFFTERRLIMNYDEALANGIRLVHSEPDLDFFIGDKYSSNNTNCYAAALGWTSSDFTIAKHPGCICGKRNPRDCYPSTEELDELVFEDLTILKLHPQKFCFQSKMDLISKIEDFPLIKNQFLIVFFIRIYPGSKEIADFHFIHYDKTNGWYEKCGRGSLYFMEDIRGYDWPTNYKAISAYILTR